MQKSPLNVLTRQNFYCIVRGRLAKTKANQQFIRQYSSRDRDAPNAVQATRQCTVHLTNIKPYKHTSNASTAIGDYTDTSLCPCRMGTVTTSKNSVQKGLALPYQLTIHTVT